MTIAIASLLVIVLAVVILLSREWIPADVVALGLMVVLVGSGLLPAERAFAGFGSEPVMALLGLLILTAALLRTGAVEAIGQSILDRLGKHRELMVPTVMVAAASLSSFISNTATTAFLLPLVITLSGRLRLPSSRLLMPLAFASILASSVSLVASSTNIVVSGLIQQQGLEPLAMFELTPVGVPIVLVGLIYMALIGQRFIPDRLPRPSLTEQFGLQPYLAELKVHPDSPLVGQTLAQAELGRRLDLTVLSIVRHKEEHLVPRSDTTLAAGDRLLVEGRREDILRVRNVVGIDLEADSHLSDRDLASGGLELAEVILLPRSPLLWNTLASLRLRERYGLQVLAIQRQGGTIRRRIGEVPMHLGDVLLVQATPASIAVLQDQGAFRVLHVLEAMPYRPRHARLVVAVFAAALTAAALEWVPLPVAVLAGSVVAFLTGAITPQEAYREVEWKLLILVAGMLSLGAAMESTGAARFLAGHLIDWLGNASPLCLLTAFFALTMLLTQPMSNQAAATVVLPIALQAAWQLGLNPRTFAAMIAVAASCSFITPLEPSCLLVFGAGHYRFLDFFRVGLPLTLLIYLVAILLVPLVWPL